MNRTEAAFRDLFRRLFSSMAEPQREHAVELHIERSRALAREQGLSPETALQQVYEEASDRATQGKRRHLPSRFVCDVGLGGLARWLRAYGYDARWSPSIDDDELIEQALRTAAFLLTTDSLMMKRGVLRDGLIPALWVPPTLNLQGQLRWVVKQLSLVPRESRCTICGGELEAVKKESVRDRIPPKTYVWLDEYWKCGSCGKLFWHGTHWERMHRTLKELGSE